jgi:peptidoglycan/xylan/chitin deacetylase (PgdA/CDA1 family)
MLRLFKKWLKAIILFICYYLGIFELFSIFFCRRGYVPILLYHCVLDDSSPAAKESSFYILGLAVLKSEFKKQAAYLRKRYTVISLKDYVERKLKKQSFKRLAVITFDDGFKDYALDVLKEYGFASTVFIFNYTFKGHYWRHRLYLLLDSSSKKSFYLDLARGERLELSLDGEENKKDAIYKIRKYLENLTPAQRDAVMDALEAKLCRESKTGLYFDKDDITEALKFGVSFGSHSLTHSDLTSLDDVSLRKEIEESRDLISSLTGKKDISFSLPFGRYNDNTLRAIRESGFLCVLTSDDGLSGPGDDLYRLKRVYINVRTMPAFAFKVSGAEMMLQWILARAYGRKI